MPFALNCKRRYILAGLRYGLIKLIFSFLLTTKIMTGLKKLDPTELRFFLQGSTSMELAEANVFKEWLSDVSWGNFLEMCTLSVFSGFLKDDMNVPLFKSKVA